LAQTKRACYDIVANLLEALSEEPANKTNLASRAKLDTRATHRYLDLISKTKLIDVDPRNTIRIASKGREYLEEYKRLKTLLEA
jgi:predicted transcriptional regulator